MLKIFLWLVVLGFLVVNGAAVIGAHYTNWQVQEAFETLSRNMAGSDEAAVRARMKQVFKMQYLDKDDLPEMFYDELQINSSEEQLEISSWYNVTVWPIGAVEAVDESGEYEPAELSGLDVLRHKLRLDFEFEPYAVSMEADR